MNTGVADGWNLGWKLATLVSGNGGPNLAASYGAERLPVADLITVEATRNYNRLIAGTARIHILDDSAAGAAERADLGNKLVSENTKAWRPVGIHLGYQYVGSPVITYGPQEIIPFDPIGFSARVEPGIRAPHIRMASGRSILDHFGETFVLVVPDGADAAGAERAAVADDAVTEVTILQLTPEETQSVYRGSMALVRPDGHVAWCGSSVGDGFKAALRKAVGF